MKMIAVSVWDRKAEEYQGLYLVRNLAVGLRDFGAAVNAPDSQYAAHPEDFGLWKVGVFDTESGEFVNETSLVIEVAELLRRSNRQQVLDDNGVFDAVKPREHADQIPLLEA